MTHLKSSILAITLLLSGCLGGTEAGNPATSTSAIPTTAPGEGQYAQAMLDTVCTKYTECYPAVSFDYCQLGVLQQTNLPAAFGASNPASTAQDMVNDERQGRIHADPDRYAACVSQIQALSCASNQVAAAAPNGAVNSANTYTGVINMIPTSGTSCAGVF